MATRLIPLIALLTGCSAQVGDGPEDGPWPGIADRWADYTGDGGAAVGQRLHPFALPDQFGSEADFRQFLGFVTVVEVGAVWCAPCQDAAATQQAFQDALQADHPAWVLSVLVEEVSGGPPDPQEAAAWADAFELQTVPVVADLVWEQRDAWDITSMPTTLVVAPDGTVVHRHDLPVDEATLEAEVAQVATDHASDLRTLP